MSDRTAQGELRLRVLAELCRSEVCLHPGQLSENVQTRTDAVSVVLRRLERGGFVKRVDRGCWEPTTRGRTYVERIRSFVAAKK